MKAACGTCGPWSRRCRGAAARPVCGRRSGPVWASGPPWARHGGGGTPGCYRGASLGWRASFLQAASAHRHCGEMEGSQMRRGFRFEVHTWKRRAFMRRTAYFNYISHHMLSVLSYMFWNKALSICLCIRFCC